MMTGITGALNFIDLPGASTVPVSLPTRLPVLISPGLFLHGSFLLSHAPAGKSSTERYGQTNSIDTPMASLCYWRGKRRLTREVYPRSPLPWTSKCSQSRPRQEKTNPKLPQRWKGTDSGCPGAASVRGFTSRNWVVRASGCVIWRAARAVFGPVHTHLLRPCLCNRLTLNQSVRERTVFL